ncbi:phospho-N-acetylmuramoyl-pentapeptide-transferase [Anaerocolumna cellulosilytica]|uniref:Phospho-N-acetylmuramoyl-pentapeptide-transferase n=1 Tax=Anaerocolumna cellulosilytica TaxID=433286 RepID=A0A6S6R6Z6_9FIRM|nr:phospho-N-acetylmuramoyl-pentapeptide-transferase [Anaerocolumna cellulosilytica]MBB5197057.1 phospho-N-acetylmuramoyl-pentapeptide-transferase [Anaerocolumna cellulosilytica]BCJ95270.1 phospho-N-acetylmuramoyl-pentapeptide-transferase [Anaerocolumna cellulosilytica]
MNFRILMPVIISFAISVILCPLLIPFLKRLKFGQFVRDDGPESHQKKSGTPTMGGIIILLSVTITSVFYIGKYKDMIPVLFATVGFGLIGFLDDYIKIVMKRSLGLRAWQKLVGQILVTAILGFYLVNYTEVGSTMLIPFTGGFQGGKYLDTSFLFVPILFLVVLGTVNGANFTDGLDGLASSVTILIATFFSVVAIGISSGISPITCAVAGSLLGFLVFNIYPARVFMGDTGSLALGGFVAASAYMLRMQLFIVIVGLIYLIEVLSVMIQVGYFKLTGGKRIFKMAPIHHHFELCGWPETRVVAVFSIVTAVLCLIALMGI